MRRNPKPSLRNNSQEIFMKSLNEIKNAFTRRRLWALGLVPVALVVAYNVVGSPKSGDAKNSAPTPSVTVDVVAPTTMQFRRAITASGTISARDELVVGSDATGVRLMEVLVDVGSVVQRGQLLARADDAQLQAQLAQQQAQVKQAQAESAQANANLERAELLKETGVYSVEQLQTRRTSAASAAAKLELAQAQRQELEVKVAHTRVVAPANGVITKKSTTIGAVVQPGTEMFRLIRDGQLEWQAELPSHSIGKVQPGVAVRIASDTGETIDAKVRQVAPTMDAGTRNGLVYVALPTRAPFKAGSHVKGEIIVDNADGLAVPESSVLMRDGYPFVYIIGADNVARLVKVETGARQDGMVEIVAGMQTEARVVSTGAGFVKEGDLVRVASSTQRVAQLGGQR
jgi:RND family efflux transporter MFP subunit